MRTGEILGNSGHSQSLSSVFHASKALVYLFALSLSIWTTAKVHITSPRPVHLAVGLFHQATRTLPHVKDIVNLIDMTKVTYHFFLISIDSLIMAVQKTPTNEMNDEELLDEGRQSRRGGHVADLEVDAEAPIEVIIEVSRDMDGIARARVQESDTLAHGDVPGIDRVSPLTLARVLESPYDHGADLGTGPVMVLEEWDDLNRGRVRTSLFEVARVAANRPRGLVHLVLLPLLVRD